MAREGALHGHYTEKSDVYSFGVLQCDVLKGKKSWKLRVDSGFTEENSTLENSWFPSDDSVGKVLEEHCGRYPEEENISAQVKKYAKLVKRCLKVNPDDRPNMIEVEKALRLIKTSLY